MTHDELRDYIDKFDAAGMVNEPAVKALRAVVELAIKQLDTTDMPAEQVAWFYEGYNLAMDNVIQAIEKELR